MAREIPLYRREVTALVDDEDYEEVIQYRWHWGDGYAYRSYLPRGAQVGKRVSMQRHLMNPPEDMVVDHLNRDRLDNRRHNLRVCTRAENNRNRDMTWCGRMSEKYAEQRRLKAEAKAREE